MRAENTPNEIISLLSNFESLVSEMLIRETMENYAIGIVTAS